MEGLAKEENEEEDNEDEDFSGGKNFDFSCPLCFFVGLLVFVTTQNQIVFHCVNGLFMDDWSTLIWKNVLLFIFTFDLLY